jgi:hypothetical protein
MIAKFWLYDRNTLCTVGQFAGIATRSLKDEDSPTTGMLVALCRAILTPTKSQRPKRAPDTTLKLTPDHLHLIGMAGTAIGLDYLASAIIGLQQAPGSAIEKAVLQWLGEDVSEKKEPGARIGMVLKALLIIAHAHQRPRSR